MKIYHIALGIFMFSFALQMVDDLRIFDMPVTPERTEINEAKVTALVNSTTELGNADSDFFGLLMIIKVIRFITEAFKTALVVYPMLNDYGVPSEIYAPLQAAIWLVYGWGLVQFISGRGTKYYD